MGALPKGWGSSNIHDVGMPSTKKINPSKFKEETFELFSVPSYSDGKPEYFKGKEIGSTKQEVFPGDVLLCKIVPHINRVWVVPPKGKYRQIASSEWIVVRNNYYESRYLKHYFSAPSFRDIFLSDLSGVGGSLTRARPQSVAKIRVPVAPANEQKRIAKKLDNLFTRSRAAREELNRIPRLIERYKQAVLSAAFSGELTRDWRLEAKNKNDLSGWEEQEFDDLIMAYQNGLSKRTGTDGKKLTVLRLADIRDSKPSLTDPRQILLTQKEAEKYSLLSGDLLVVRVNGSKEIVGRLVLISSDVNAAYCDHFIRLRLNGRCDPAWLAHFGNSSEFRRHIFENMVSSAGQNTVSQGTLKGYRLKLPPLSEQKEIVRRVEKAFTAIDAIATQSTAALRQIAHLEAQCLNKAFRGELIPQDPNDEPASVLLERIKQQAEKPAVKSRGRKKRA